MNALALAVLLAGLDFTRQDVSVDLSGASPVIDLDLTVRSKGATGTFDFLIPPAAVAAFDVDGASVTPHPHPDYPQYLYQATLPAQLADGATAHLHARLSGAMRCGGGATQPPACFSGAEGTILLPASYDAAWYFVNLYEESDPFEGEVKVRAPAAQTVLAGHGAGTSVDLGDGTKRWTYSLAVPLDMLFITAAQFSSVEAAGPYTVKAFFPPGLGAADKEQHAADLAAKVLPIYGRLFGELPVREAHLMTVPPNFPAAGMGLLANVFMADYIFGSHGYLLEQGVAHEFAHSWWGNLSSGAGDERAFMAEAFAEYSAWRALGEVQGDAARTSGMRMNAVWYMYRTPAGQDVAPLSADVTQQPGFVFVTYHKGPLALRALEELAGVEKFTAALKAVAALGPGKGSIAGLVSEVQKAGGPDLTAAVDQWLHAPGFPRLKVTASGGGRWALQSEGAFEYRLPVRVRYAGGRVVEQVLEVKPGASSVTLPLDSDVETIEADPRWTLPREVKPAVAADVTLDGVVDGRDLLEVAVHVGGVLPTQRRVDGRYDPLFDVDSDFEVGVKDLEAITATR